MKTLSIKYNGKVVWKISYVQDISFNDIYQGILDSLNAVIEPSIFYAYLFYLLLLFGLIAYTIHKLNMFCLKKIKQGLKKWFFLKK